MIKVQCKICGKDFEVKPCKIRVGWGKYCSRECQWKSLIGRKHPHKEETKKKIGNANRGRNRPDMVDNQYNKGKSGYWLGKKRSDKTKEKISLAHKGKHHSPATEFKWINGNSSENDIRLHDKKYIKQRNKAYKRDKYMCQMCKIKCLNRKSKDTKRWIACHHIKDEYDHRLENLQTLCASCHSYFHRTFGRT